MLVTPWLTALSALLSTKKISYSYPFLARQVRIRMKSPSTENNKEDPARSRRTSRRKRNLHWIFGAIIVVSTFASLSQMRRILSLYINDSNPARRISLESMIPWEHFKLLKPRNHANKTDVENKILDVMEGLFSSQIGTSDELSRQLWEGSTVIPQWMKNYLAWHREHRTKLSEENWKNYKYIIMIAPSGKIAGGVTDRLRPLPTLLRIANMTERLFLIYWERPAHLEEFLLPPGGGLDWRTPHYIIPHLADIKPNGNQKEIVRVAKGHRMIQVTFYQSWNYGELWYDENLEPNEPDAKTVLKSLWQIAFTPSPPVASIIEGEFQQMGIIPGEYATAHIRALYARETRPIHEIQALTQNALNCASELRPGGPFYVASDSSYATKLAHAYGNERNVTVVSRANAHRQEPLHIGHHEADGANLTVSDFYDTFVDIYLISMTRCVAFGKGGYGRWGLLMGFNNTCHHTHHGSKWAKRCRWTEPSSQDKAVYRREAHQLKLPLFYKPMPDRHHYIGAIPVKEEFFQMNCWTRLCTHDNCRNCLV